MTEPDFTALHAAFLRGDIEAIRRWFGFPATFPNLEAPPLAIGPVLQYAIYHSPPAAIAGLIELGADISFDPGDGFPALHAAIARGGSDAPAVVSLLIARGADIESRGLNDWTPLHYAAACGRRDIVELLLQYGADRLARTRIDDQATAADEARRNGHIALAELLQV